MRLLFAVLITTIFAVISISHLPFAQAGIISGDYLTAAGKSVDLQELEWLSLDVTAGYSRTQIENGSLDLMADGWQYASRVQTAILLNSLWGGEYSGGHSTNGDGADWFFNYLGHGRLTYGYNDLYNFFYGTEEECSSDPTVSCLGLYRVVYPNDGPPSTGWFYDVYGLDASISNPMLITDDEANAHFGSLLVRSSTPVPEPTTLLLIGTGLFGLLVVVRKKKKK